MTKFYISLLTLLSLTFFTGCEREDPFDFQESEIIEENPTAEEENDNIEDPESSKNDSEVLENPEESQNQGEQDSQESDKLEEPDQGDQEEVELPEIYTKGIKILTIGNSFSLDAAQYYLPELLKSMGINATIGNLSIAGCTLEKHWDNIQNNKGAYDFYRHVNGKSYVNSKIKLSNVIKLENWDIITIQQGSALSFDYNSYVPYLQNILEWVRERSDAKIYFHQTWAYSKDAFSTDLFAEKDPQLEMYQQIVATVIRAKDEHPLIYDIIPSGTAIQNGRTSSLGDTFNVDSFHLEKTYGRLTATFTWLEKLTGISCLDLSYGEDFLNSTTLEICKKAAHAAIINPTEITYLAE